MAEIIADEQWIAFRLEGFEGCLRLFIRILRSNLGGCAKSISEIAALVYQAFDSKATGRNCRTTDQSLTRKRRISCRASFACASGFSGEVFSCRSRQGGSDAGMRLWFASAGVKFAGAVKTPMSVRSIGGSSCC